MTREIGFRAWVEDLKYYFYDVAVYPNNVVAFQRHNIESMMLNAQYGVTQWTELGEDAIIEQYTGLKDKNGKKIYEGDIVKTTDRVTAKGLIFPVGVVEFKQQAFWICNVPSERPDFTHNETLLQYWETDLEVVGNIHEDKELMKGEE